MSTKKLLGKVLLHKKYYGDNIDDIEQDVYDAIQDDEDIPVDEHFFTQGEYELTLTWKQTK